MVFVRQPELARTLFNSQPEKEVQTGSVFHFHKLILAISKETCFRHSFEKPLTLFISLMLPLSLALRIIFYFEGCQKWSVMAFLLSLIPNVIGHEFFPFYICLGL